VKMMRTQVRAPTSPAVIHIIVTTTNEEIGRQP
jgi:hypothetical protein